MANYAKKLLSCRQNPVWYLFLLSLILFIFVSCGKPSIRNMDREELFSLGLGKMENQIDLFQVPGIPFDKTNLIYRKGGRIYVVNGNSSKIMEFTPFGDLVFLLQNSDQNPKPVILSNEDQGEISSNRLARSFPFQNIGTVVVDSQKNIYVEDYVPKNQKEMDSEYPVVLYKRILRFDREGKYIDFVGQEGIGGAPFPFIESVFISREDELVVVTRMNTKWVVFWFSREGRALYRVDFEQANLPPYRNFISSLTKIVPEYNNRRLLIMITYYEEEINESTQTKDAIKNSLARIYRYNLETETYEDSLDIPASGKRKEVVGVTERDISAPSYEFLGTTIKNSYFFMRPAERNRFELLILKQDGATAIRRLFMIEDSELCFKDMNLSEEGILSALLCFQDEVKIVSWRSDKLLEEESP